MTFRYLCTSLAAALMLFSGALRANEPNGLISILPADTALLLHVRSLPELRSQWEQHPLSKTWAEEEVQDFLAPAIEQFREENPGGLVGLIQAETGLTPDELLDLFPGEFALAVLDLQVFLDDESEAAPELLILAELGEDTSPVEELIERMTEEDARVTEEEFQGELLRTIELPAEEGEVESATWTIVDQTLVMGATKTSVQLAVDNLKSGGAAEPLSRKAGFESIYRENPGAHLAGFLNLEAVVPALMDAIKKGDRPGEDGSPSPLSMVGMTPEGLFDAMGLGELTSAYGVAVLEEEATLIATGMKWRERPNLMKMLAYGEPPAPRPAFVPDTWLSVSSGKFSISEGYAGLKDILREASPGLLSLIDTRIAEFNQFLGIDIERDLIGNFGDEIVQAESLTEGDDTLQPDQFYALAIQDADTARRMVDAALALVPGIAQALVSREYLGETIVSMIPPEMPDVPEMAKPRGFSYAITRSHLFITMGGPDMLETAIQGLGGASNSIWENQEIVEALNRLPGGESMLAYQDTRRLVVALVDLIAKGGGLLGPDEEGNLMFDPAAVPSPETLAQYWGNSVSAVYIDDDGIRSVGHLSHGDIESE